MDAAPKVLTGNWDVKMEAWFLTYASHHKYYSYDSVLDLLFLIGNTLSHQPRLPKDIQMSEAKSSNAKENVPVQLLFEQETHISSAIHNGIRLWLTQRFEDYGWGEPWVWTSVTKTDIPYQQNETDCGFFAIGYAEHCIHRRPIRFTQADIPYYRRKILVEIFKRSWLLNADRLHLPNLPAL